MPEYTVLGGAPDCIHTWNFTVHDDEGRVFVLTVKGMSDGEPLVGKQIILKTTNREVLPQDIYVPEWEETLEEETVPEPPTLEELEIDED
jgi:hypothetical protein